jgi:hypothetical protein
VSRHTPEGQWGITHLAQLLGTNGPMIGRYLNGLSYPTLQMMQKFEIVFGWPLVEQVQLIPPYWTWPDQRYEKTDHPTDLRYAMMMHKIVKEWGEANPRTEKLQFIRQHPSIPHKRLPK